MPIPHQGATARSRVLGTVDSVTFLGTSVKRARAMDRESQKSVKARTPSAHFAPGHWGVFKRVETVTFLSTSAKHTRAMNHGLQNNAKAITPSAYLHQGAGGRSRRASKRWFLYCFCEFRFKRMTKPIGGWRLGRLDFKALRLGPEERSR